MDLKDSDQEDHDQGPVDDQDGIAEVHPLTLDAYASKTQYVDHLAPVLRELPGAQLYVPTHALASWARNRGVRAVPGQPPGIRPVLVAAYRDEAAVGGSIILLEHGAGQHYGGVVDDGSAEDTDRNRVILYLGPNQEVADRMRQVLPLAERLAIGCPRLDRHAITPRRQADTPTVGFAWHWPSRGWPESRWAWPEYRRTILDMSLPWPRLGHGHPRAISHLSGHYRRARIPVTGDVEEFLDGIDLLVADNTSLMWEAAAIGIPLVIVDASYYRTGIHHGLRFWTWADIGPRARKPAELRGAILRGWEERHAYAPLRASMRDAVYGSIGGAARLAADAIRSRVG